MAEGPSKNELKKLAKKAEKAAKKAANKLTGGGGETNKEAPAAGKPATAAAQVVAPLTKAPKVLLYQGGKDDLATLKVVWAALHYNVEMGIAKKKDLPRGFSSSSKKAALVYGSGDYVLGGGGNAMCKAIGLMGGGSLNFEVDEWCEVERTILRRAGKKPLKLDALATALESSATGVHLVGESDTVADICVLVTLSKHAADIASWPSKYHCNYFF